MIHNDTIQRKSRPVAINRQRTSFNLTAALLLPIDDLHNTSFTIDKLAIAVVGDDSYTNILGPFAARLGMFGYRHNLQFECLSINFYSACIQEPNSSPSMISFYAKLYLQQHILAQGYHMVFSDLDVFWQRDVVSAIRAVLDFDVFDILISPHHHDYNQQMNSGMFYAKPNGKVKLFYQEVMHRTSMNPQLMRKCGDQCMLNDALRVNGATGVLPPIAHLLDLNWGPLPVGVFGDWEKSSWGSAPIHKQTSLHFTNLHKTNKMICLADFYGINNCAPSLAARPAAKFFPSTCRCLQEE